MRFLSKIILGFSIGFAIEVGRSLAAEWLTNDNNEFEIDPRIKDLYEKYKPANDLAREEAAKGSARTMTKEETAATDNKLWLSRVERQEHQAAYASQTGTRNNDEATAWGAENGFIQENGLVYAKRGAQYAAIHPKTIKIIKNQAYSLATQSDFNHMYNTKTETS